MRRFTGAGRSGLLRAMLVAMCWHAAAAAAAPSAAQLIGAWRLVAIEYRGPRGETLDPFYQAGSTGLLIYDASGWMSVQISAPRRRGAAVPDARAPVAPAGAGDAALKADAFDSFYSYFGTWRYDPAAGTVTHHLASSLLPAEDGLDYTQSVQLDKNHLVFTNRSGPPGATTLRRKIWEKLAAPARPAAD